MDGDLLIREWLCDFICTLFQLFHARAIVKSKDYRTGKLFCDFKDLSSTINGMRLNIPNVGLVPSLVNPLTGSLRDTGQELLIFSFEFARGTQ